MATDFRALVEAARDVIAVLDRDGRYLFVNDAIERATGVPPAALVGKSNDELMTPVEAAPWRTAIATVLATGIAQEVDCTLDTPRGRRTFSALISRLDDSHVTAISRDITDLRAAERSRDRTRQLHTLTTAVSRATESTQVLTIFADAGRHALGASAGFAWMLRDADTLVLAATAHDGRNPSIENYGTISLAAPLPICDAVRSGQPLLFETYSSLVTPYPAAANPTRYKAWAIVPIVSDGRGIGAASFSFEAERIFTDDDRELLVAMAGQAALALERCRSLEAHLQSEERLRQALSAARAATWTLDLQTMRSQRDANYRALVGDEVATAPADFGFVHPDDRHIAKQAFERAIRDGVPYEPVIRLRRTDGSYFWIQAHGRITRDAAGTPVTMSGVIVDIDEAKRASLRAEQDRRLNESMHRIAASFATELDRDRLVHRIIDELTRAFGAETGSFYPGDTEVAHDHSGSMLEVPIVSPGGELFGRLQFRHRDPERFTEEHQRLAASVAAHAAIALENANLYRSEREHKEQLERAIERAHVADRRKDEFLAMLGHELRNPLAPIATALELLEMKQVEGGRKEREVIQRQVSHLSRLIDDLLDMSRITRGKIQLAKETLEISNVLAKAIEMASPLLEKRQQHLAIDMPAVSALVDADPTRLAQVFQNLLTNAAKYSDPRSRIELAVTTTDDHIIVSIRDHGVGINAELLPRLFDMFVQGERSLDRAQGGLGIGLTIARSLCELHGGTISAASEGQGKGSTFTVTLPRSIRPRVSTDRMGMPPLERPHANHSGTRVLVVDDNVDASLMLREMLSELGHHLEVAHDGPSALEVAATFKPDIAVLDIGLPVMSGYELARKLREQRGQRPLRLIAVTGYGQDTDRARARDAGFDHHLVKPIALDALLALLVK